MKIRKTLLFCTSLAFLIAACAQATGTAQPAASSVNTQVSTQAAASLVPTTGEPGCTVITRQPTPGPTQRAIIPPVDDQDWVKGPQDAYVTIIEYGDFQ